MKHLKTFENSENKDNINKLKNDLLYILNQELYTSDGEITWIGKECAVEEIVTYLTNIGIDFDLYFDSKKYNI